MEKTTNYEMFKKFEYNRNVKEKHVEKLMEEISKRNKLDIHPLLVTPDMHIIDGQHRLEAARRLHVPVYYLVDPNYDPTDMQVFNHLRLSWTLNDYVLYYANLGNEDYLKILEFGRKYDLAPYVAFLYCSKRKFSGKACGLFKKGQYTFTECEPEVIKTLFALREMLEENGITTKAIFTSPAFHEAFIFFISNILIDPEVFLDKLGRYFHLFKKQTSRPAWIKMFLEIYNYRNRNRIEAIARHNHLILVRVSNDIG